ncbi:hypothetical protein DVH24_034070 [Malus domestica]|uniref:Uncharacterized protein n=1 Tax=Malus domestica TaxID=3750 RepID=A0A498KX04_MALDO|nr:hypothetical protein DVH24_034070 [Malus domestica]
MKFAGKFEVSNVFARWAEMMRKRVKRRDPIENEAQVPDRIFFYTCTITSRLGADHFLGPLHHRSTILSALGPDHALTWVTHHGSALAPLSLNFGVPTEPEASELPKGLMLGMDRNIHLRITPLGDVGCYNPPPLGARRPRRHTFGQGLALIPICHIPARGGPLPGPAPPP